MKNTKASRCHIRRLVMNGAGILDISAACNIPSVDLSNILRGMITEVSIRREKDILLVDISCSTNDDYVPSKGIMGAPRQNEKGGSAQI